MKLLIVEDDSDQIDIIKDAAEEYCEKICTQLNIETDICRNLTEALDKIDHNKNQFDGAIVDISLVQGDPDRTEGNEVISIIKENRRFPIRVVSSDISKVAEEHEDSESSFFKIYDRSSINTVDLIRELHEIYQTGITNLLKEGKGIEDKIQNIVWNHLAQDLSSWSSSTGPSETSLMRYILTHLVEYLDLSDESGHYNDAEYYIIPPIRKFLSSGDIVKDANQNLYIILSPACDIAIRKVIDDVPQINAEKITLVKLYEVNDDTYRSFLKIEGKLTKKALTKKLEPIMKGQDPRLHYLPKYRDIKASIADFRNIYSISFTSEFYGKYDRLGTISSHFFKDIQSKFSSYHARQGAPNIDISGAIEYHMENIN